MQRGGQLEDANDMSPADNELMKYNSQMRRHKRKISLSEVPDEVKRELEPEVSITPNMKENIGLKLKQLFVSDSEPMRSPPLTQKQ